MAAGVQPTAENECLSVSFTDTHKVGVNHASKVVVWRESLVSQMNSAPEKVCSGNSVYTMMTSHYFLADSSYTDKLCLL